MKKIALLLSAVILAASCTINGGYNESYQVLCTFEYGVDYEEAFGPDSIYFDAQYKTGMQWNDLVFKHKIADDGTFQGGFLISHLKPAGMNGQVKDQEMSDYRVAGKPFSFDNTYAVYKMNMDPTAMPDHDIDFISKEYGTCTVKYCWVNNTETVYNAAKKFENGDKLVLTATGYRNGAVTGTAEINLALPDTTIYNWTKFNLEKLGTVDAIDFELYASRTDIPTCFCLDELSATVDITY
jgi:hypothetical protein